MAPDQLFLVPFEKPADMDIHWFKDDISRFIIKR